MAVPFSNTKLRPPRGFRNILSGLSREVLRSQPGDIYAFGTLYLEQLLKIRHESGLDVSAVGSEFEDIYYNKVFRRAGERLVVESKAALKIQTAYRRYRATVYVKALRKDRAAVKLQAGFHGIMSRKKVKQMRADELSDRDRERHVADLADAEDIERENEFPAISDYQDAIDDPREPNARSGNSIFVICTPEMSIAKERIHAGFKGLATRQTLNIQGSTHQQHDEPEGNDGEDIPCEMEDSGEADDENIDIPHEPSSS